MENAYMLAAILGPIYVIMGLAILIYPTTFAKLMKGYADNHFNLFALMIFNLFLGMVIVHMYNSWELNVYILVTISGWGALLKGALYMLLPGSTTKAMMKSVANSGMMVFSGLVVLVMGGLLSYHSYML